MITIASVIVVTLWQLHPSMLLTNTTTTGGDTGAHIAMPKFLESLVSHGHLTGWDPGWYDGFPLYTFYFTIPDLFIAIGGWIIPYGVAFKLGTVLGSVMLPVCAWACGRFFRLRAPLPTLLAAATLPFLFDYTFTIYGGNLFSTLAGSTHFPSACRWRCCLSGSSPVPSGRGGTAAGQPSCWPVASSPTSSPACTPWVVPSS